jgi:hypothetical protein
MQVRKGTLFPPQVGVFIKIIIRNVSGDRIPFLTAFGRVGRSAL